MISNAADIRLGEFMIKFILAFAILSQPVFADDESFEPDALCFAYPSGCGGYPGTPGKPVQTAEQHALFLEGLKLAKESPDLAGMEVAVRVNIEWAVVDRKAEKKSPPPPTPGTLETVAGLVKRATSARASATFVYKRVTGYDSKGNPLYETFTIQIEGAVGGAAEAQAAMDAAMEKNHK
jgi:hypothetical protein